MTSCISFPYKSSLTFSCLLVGTAWPTLSFLVIICWVFLCFLYHHHIFARICRCLTKWLDATALTEVPRHWAALRNEYSVPLLCTCNESVAVKIFHVLQSMVTLTLAGCQTPTQLLFRSTSSTWQEEKIRWKSSWVEIKPGKSLASHCQGQNRLDLEKVGNRMTGNRTRLI